MRRRGQSEWADPRNLAALLLRRYLDDQRKKAVEAEWLGDVMRKTGREALCDVLGHAVAADCDSFQAVLVAQLPHQLEPAALIGQTEIAHHEVELAMSCGL